jgi:hypothetical protein
LIPVELFLLMKPLVLILAALLLLSGVGPDIWSLDRALHRGRIMALVTMMGVLVGVVLVPLLLPCIPGRQFWLKGLLLGTPVGLFTVLWFWPLVGWPVVFGMALWAMSVSSYLAMNFTGSTPYTSLSGVELEIRKGLAIQLVAAMLGLCCWLAGPFFH